MASTVGRKRGAGPSRCRKHWQHRSPLASCAAMTETSPTAPPRRAAVFFIFVTILIDMLAVGIIIPVLPSLVGSFLGGDAERTAEMLGLFGTVWALMQFLCSPILGALSDRYGRRPVILVSNFGLGLDYVVMAL